MDTYKIDTKKMKEKLENWKIGQNVKTGDEGRDVGKVQNQEIDDRISSISNQTQGGKT
jgi:hypothetical protein